MTPETRPPTRREDNEMRDTNCIPASEPPAARLRGEAPPPAECLDCGMAYEDFPMDVILPRAQWLEIHPDEHGLLCAGCIVARASKVPGATACHLIIEVAPK